MSEIYEILSPGGHETMTEQIFTYVKTYIDTHGPGSKVDRAGDTMTGILTQSRVSNSYYISKTDTHALTTASNNGITSNTDMGGLLFRDKNDANLGDVHVEMHTDGRVVLSLFAQNKKTDGTSFSNVFNIYANKDGSATYAITSPANFRSTLGLTGAATNGQYSRSSTGGLDWGTNNNYLVQKNVLAFWNGTYDGTNSNLQRCNRGAFGTIVTKNTGDYLATSGNGSLSGTITNASYFKQKCQGLLGICASGRNDGHTYQFNWNSSSKLEFWVDTTNVNSLSDRRLKYDIEEVTSDTQLLDIIDNCKMYTYKADNRNGQISMGIMAQDFMSECEKHNLTPEDYEVFGVMQYTNDDETEYYTIEYDQYAVIKCAALERRIKQLEEMIIK